MRLRGDSRGGWDLDPALSEFAARWAAAVRDTSYLAAGAPDLSDLLTTLARQAAEALLADPFSDARGFEIGRCLVTIGLSTVESLRRSLVQLAGLPRLLGLPPDSGTERAGLLLGAICAGFTRANRDKTLVEQERLRSTAVTAMATASQRALRDSEARLRAMFDSTAIAIAIGDLEGRIIEANAALGEMLGVTAAQLVGRSVFDFFEPEDLPQIHQEVYGQLRGGARSHVKLEKRFTRANGEIGWATLAVSLVRTADGTPAHLVAMGEDVTERHRLQSELHHQAHHDPLTGLPNRLLLYRHLDEAVRSAAPDSRIGLCFIDLDEFKTVNDTLGHGSGDRLLVAVAERLRECAGGVGHFVARVGGDEFVVVVRASEGSCNLTTLAQLMLGELAKPVRLDGHELSVSASIGIVEQPASGADAEEMLRAADATLHLAKADGRARFAVFDAQRNAQQLLRYGLTGRLSGGIERGEFELEYQPLVSLVDNRLRGAEALLRWRHPELGTLSPNTFVPVAEQSGMIGMLGRWVLRESCAQAARWQRRFPDAAPLVSVNVSVRQCTDPHLLDDVTTALSDSGLEPGNLQLELTETVLMQSYDRPQQTLLALAELGVRIVIDDFGIGYSNLAYLRHLPVHGLKLAGSFMAGIRAPATDRVDEQIVETVIRLAHTLGMTVTAEGVETADQAARLASLGCDLAQGWHFGRPGTGTAIEELVALDSGR